MATLVHRLQAAATDRDQKVSDVLRTALVVATKLGVEDFKAWCWRELNGYGVDDKLPEYRYIRGAPELFNTVLGVQQTWAPGRDLLEWVKQVRLPDAIAGIEKHAEGKAAGEFGQSLLPVELLSDEVRRKGWIPIISFSYAEYLRILDTVRNTVLQWSLKLEQDGILGGDEQFTSEEKSTASHNTYNIGTFIGVAGDVQSSQVQIGDGNRIDSVVAALPLDDAAKAELKEILEDLSAASPDEKPKLRKQAFEWLGKHASEIGVYANLVMDFLRVSQ